MINTKRYEFESSHQQRNEISKTVSEDKLTPVKPLSNNQRYDIPSNIEKGLNEPNFITLGKISEKEKIEIIKLGFQLQAEGRNSLKNYYEKGGNYSLFEWKGYRIKYENIRKTDLSNTDHFCKYPIFNSRVVHSFSRANCVQ